MPTPPSNREQFRTLCEEGDITQKKAAELIARSTRRPCSDRTVRAWLTDADKPSARPCPDWAIDVLKTSLKKAKK